MTDLLFTDAADSGEVVRLHDPIVDPERRAVGEETANIAPYLVALPPFRRPALTGETPVYRPATIGVVDGPATEVLCVAGLTSPSGPSVPPKPVPPPVPPRWVDGEVAEYPAVPVWSARLPRGRHRAAGSGWQDYLVTLVVAVVGGALGGLLLGGLLLWAVTR